MAHTKFSFFLLILHLKKVTSDGVCVFKQVPNFILLEFWSNKKRLKLFHLPQKYVAIWFGKVANKKGQNYRFKYSKM